MSFCARLAAHFALHPRVWIDGLDLARLGGVYAYRTRLSDLRRPPYSMVIENRQRRLANGTVRSEYRYVPRATTLLELAEAAETLSNPL